MNYLLLDRVARMLGPIARYATGPQAGQLVAPFGGLVGEPLINVLKVNLELHRMYGAPA
ncbi:K+-transporting ATPase c subunit [Caballeronia udeis]|jgi:K+-transporting ATPase c subunit|uniref:K+-transporting ATPase c subunit n=1 Tax=Caballeronia udeis TaxID=1232866 RepID=A0ABW8MR64_9BURK